MNEKKFFSTRNVTYLAVLLAFVIVFQIISSFVPLPEGVSLNLTLVPIVLGGILLGAMGGAFLGIAFAVIVIIMSVSMPNGLMPVIMSSGGALTVFILSTLIRGFAAGFIPALLYKLVAKKNAYVATFVAAAAAPIINTAIFILSTLAIFGILPDEIGMSALDFFMYLVITVSGINFLIELAINMILSPAIFTVVRVVSGRRSGAVNKISEEQDASTEEQNENPTVLDDNSIEIPDSDVMDVLTEKPESETTDNSIDKRDI